MACESGHGVEESSPVQSRYQMRQGIFAILRWWRLHGENTLRGLWKYAQRGDLSTPYVSCLRTKHTALKMTKILNSLQLGFQRDGYWKVDGTESKDP